MDIVNETIKEIINESNNHKRLNWDNFEAKLNKRILDEFKFNELLYVDFGDVEMTHKEYDNISIYAYWDDEKNKINVSIPENRWDFDTEDEAIEFINKNIIEFLERLDDVKRFIDTGEL